MKMIILFHFVLIMYVNNFVMLKVHFHYVLEFDYFEYS